jgi:D-alanyl-D-alanine carboxypeptidase (penicillin-binding protein 5/6)
MSETIPLLAPLSRRRALLAATSFLAAGAALPARAAPKKTLRKEAAKDAPPPAPTSPATTPLGPLDTEARYAFVTDFNTGATLLDKDADVPMVPSSMTKLMTMYIVYGQLKSGRMKLDDMLPVSEKAWRMGGSKMFVPYPGSVKVEDLIRGVVVDSGNDACIVFAEAIAGSEEQFVVLMNQKAKELGLTQSVFKNCTGMPDPGHVMSCRDIATLAARIIRDYPEYYHYDSEKSFKFNNIEQYNRNPLVQKGLADGLKTGHTEAGGYGLAASAERAGRRVILVINGLPTSRARSEESERLLEWAFRNFENVKLLTAGEVLDRAPVWLGASPSVPLVAATDVTLTVPHQWQNKVKVSLHYEAPLIAPVSQGTRAGVVRIEGEGVPATEIALLAGADVPRLSLPGRALAVITHRLFGS